MGGLSLATTLRDSAPALLLLLAGAVVACWLGGWFGRRGGGDGPGHGPEDGA